MNMKKIVIAGLSIFLLLGGGVVAAQEHIIEQKGKVFVMKGAHIEEFSVKVGDTIKFQNEDTFFHNIFSLSDLKTFDLGSFPKGDSRTVTFDEAGMIEIECAIHPDMYMEVEVK